MRGDGQRETQPLALDNHGDPALPRALVLRDTERPDAGSQLYYYGSKDKQPPECGCPGSGGAGPPGSCAPCVAAPPVVNPINGESGIMGKTGWERWAEGQDGLLHRRRTGHRGSRRDERLGMQPATPRRPPRHSACTPPLLDQQGPWRVRRKRITPQIGEELVQRPGGRRTRQHGCWGFCRAYTQRGSCEHVLLERQTLGLSPCALRGEGSGVGGGEQGGERSVLGGKRRIGRRSGRR